MIAFFSAFDDYVEQFTRDHRWALLVFPVVIGVLLLAALKLAERLKERRSRKYKHSVFAKGSDWLDPMK